MYSHWWGQDTLDASCVSSIPLNAFKTIGMPTFHFILRVIFKMSIFRKLEFIDYSFANLGSKSWIKLRHRAKKSQGLPAVIASLTLLHALKYHYSSYLVWPVLSVGGLTLFEWLYSELDCSVTKTRTRPGTSSNSITTFSWPKRLGESVRCIRRLAFTIKGCIAISNTFTVNTRRCAEYIEPRGSRASNRLFCEIKAV